MELDINVIEKIAELCVYRNKNIPICDDWLDRKECEKKLCCGKCPENSSCDIICDVILNELKR